MGIYCYLYLGSTPLSWKGQIPDLVSLLFEPDQYVASPNKDEEWYEHRLISSCGKIADKLRGMGIDVAFMRKLYFEYFAFDFDQYKDALYFHCEQYLTRKYPDSAYMNAERMTNILLSKFNRLSADEEFEKILREKECRGNPAEYLASLSDFVKSSSGHRIIDRSKIDLIDLSRSSLRDFLQEDPYLRQLNSDATFSGSGSFDLDLLFDVGIAVFASRPGIPVEFEFSEFIETPEVMSTAEVQEFLLNFRTSIQRRTEDLTLAFSGLANSLPKATVTLPAPAIDRATFSTNKDKGNFLEEIVELVFVSQFGFYVKKNVQRPDQEIDLLIVNKLADPFWTALQSPIILVECKNQKVKVEPKDLRNFEVKIIDRKGLCRLGIIVSTSGFTRGCYEAAARCGRDGYRVILIDGETLQKRINSDVKTVDWLEDIILEQC